MPNLLGLFCLGNEMGEEMQWWVDIRFVAQMMVHSTVKDLQHENIE